jgi:two-component system chemotaxis response regulator CheB
MSRCFVTGQANGVKTAVLPLAPKSPPTDVFLPAGIRPRLVAIAASTGGPGALASVLRPLPADFPVPILVVQHISVGFATSFATWLDRQVALSVRIGSQDDEPKPGEVLIAPDHCHMGINKKGRIVLQDKMPKETICPSANFLFQSVANAYGAMTIGVVLTGMGDDGADGLQAMHEKGAYTIAQNKETCVVFGMPAVAIERGVIKQVQPLDQIGSTLARLAQA